jgi:phosphopantothenoylcysteine decarboxylase/phosphopantothenate--cysteine ligase
MGFALARAAKQRGADVTAVAGATTTEEPAGIKMVRVTSAEEMADAVAREITNSTVFIGAAAVADYRPVQRAEQKIKKTHQSIILELERTPDILTNVVASRREGTLVIGFAAESENLLQNARSKLDTKRLDAIVANDITQSGSGFDSETNAIKIFTRINRNVIELPMMSKIDAANHILDTIVQLRSEKTAAQTISR